MFRIVALVTLALCLVAPDPARAARVVDGFTNVNVEERRYLRVNITLAGPLQAGEYAVGFVRGRRLDSEEKVTLDAAGAGEFANISVLLRPRQLAGPHHIGVDGPGGRVGDYRTTIVPGPKQEAFLGKRGQKTLETWFERRAQDLKLGWIDDSGKHLAAVFYLKVRRPGDTVDIVFKHGKKKVCRDSFETAGTSGQINRVRAYCRKTEEVEADQPDVVLDDDSVYYDQEITGDQVEIDASAVGLDDALKVEEAVKRKGPWTVEVRRGKKLLRVLSFSVSKDGEVVAGLSRNDPMKAAKVRHVAD